MKPALDWDKSNGLIPAIVQDFKTKTVLMLGYMSQESFTKTLETRKVTFYSRSRKQLWTKGESSGNELKYLDWAMDCDGDSLLIRAEPTGPICHKDEMSCFMDSGRESWSVIDELEKTIKARQQSRPENSYVSSLFNAGLNKIAQKVGEESVEVVIAALSKDDQDFCGEVADLMFHLLVLLKAKGVSFSQVLRVLEERRK